MKKEGIGKLTFVLSRRETNYYYQPPFPIRIWLIPSNNKYIVIIVFIEEVVNLFYIQWVSDDCSYLCKGLIVLCSVAFVCCGELVKGVVVVPMLFKTSRLPLASNSLVDCWVSVPRLLLGWMVRVCCQLPLLA